ncbi:hypothetical protein CesoFtcFv8_005822 [Champsocephalus esox]|nr:hypothetical protein CesoFtcFv8_005822 [Champsocephalus esox]
MKTIPDGVYPASVCRRINTPHSRGTEASQCPQTSGVSRRGRNSCWTDQDVLLVPPCRVLWVQNRDIEREELGP